MESETLHGSDTKPSLNNFGKKIYYDFETPSIYSLILRFFDLSAK